MFSSKLGWIYNSGCKFSTMGNQIKTTMLLAVMTALILGVGQILGGRQGILGPAFPLKNQQQATALLPLSQDWMM